MAVPKTRGAKRGRPRIAPGPPDGGAGAGSSAPTVVAIAPLLHGFAVQCQVETVALGLLLDAQADDDVDHLEDDEAGEHVPRNDDRDALDLVEDLARIALEQAGGAAVLLNREHAGQD